MVLCRCLCIPDQTHLFRGHGLDHGVNVSIPASSAFTMVWSSSSMLSLENLS
jgi:hypothetical protein